MFYELRKVAIFSVASFFKEDIDLGQVSRRPSNFDIYRTAIRVDELEFETGPSMSVNSRLRTPVVREISARRSKVLVGSI